MIAGVGLDIVSVDRIAHAMRNPRFLDRILTPRERESCRTAQQVAGRWAAKEAVAKAVGTHLRWQEVEVLNDASGKPVARVHGRTLKLRVSISHEQGMAAAVVILED